MGIGGGPTVGVIVVFTKRSSESFAWYRTGVCTWPVNVGNGLNVTVPSLLTVYVPSPGTVSDVFEQAFGDSASSIRTVAGSSRPHNFTEVANNGKSVAPAVSLPSGVYV